MEFNVKGITFNKEDLTTIALTDIKVDAISRSHLFHLLPGSKRAVLLLRAGDYVEASFVSKYIEKGMVSMYQLEVCSVEDLNEFKMMWGKLKQSRTQRDQFLVRDEIIQKISKDFWSSKDKSFLSFVISCFEEFYVYDIDVLDKYQRLSMILYTRNLLIASISCITSLCNGYVDYRFIKDFYNVSFIMDYGLIEYEEFNYALSLASEAERKEPGSGIPTLIKYKRSEGEIIIFKGHPNISYEFAIDFEDRFFYPELINLVQMHHEKCDGSGFPNGYSYSAMSDTETLLMFCDYLIPFEEHVFVKGDGFEVLNTYLVELNKLETKYLLPINKLVANWEMMMNWASREEIMEEVA